MKRKILILAPLLFLLFVSCIAIHTDRSTSSGPTALFVTRVSLFPANDFAPFQTTVNDATTVQQLYHAAFALPVVPHGGLNQLCLNDPGLRYHLNFQLTTVPSYQMILNPGGCEVLIIGKADFRQMNAAFLNLFAQTIHVTSLTAPSL